jgi:hypothetical protein
MNPPAFQRQKEMLSIPKQTTLPCTAFYAARPGLSHPPLERLNLHLALLRLDQPLRDEVLQGHPQNIKSEWPAWQAGPLGVGLVTNSILLPIEP